MTKGLVSTEPELITSRSGVHFDPISGEMHYTTQHDIPDFFLDELADIRAADQHERCGDHHLVARIPEGVVDTMYRRGYRIHEMSNGEIIKWLRNNGFEKLIATSKNVSVERR